MTTESSNAEMETEQETTSVSTDTEKTADVSQSIDSSVDSSSSESSSIGAETNAGKDDMSSSVNTIIERHINSAAEDVGALWPIHSFVTANPLDGFENRPFHEAIAAGAVHFDGDGYPDPSVFERAWRTGRIDNEILASTLIEYEVDHTPASAIAAIDADTVTRSNGNVEVDNQTDNWDKIDKRVIKWLSAFLDAGSAEWAMPNRKEGFYVAFQAVAMHDTTIPDVGVIRDPPADPLDTVSTVLESYPESEWNEIIEAQMTSLPGWTGLICRRIEDETTWQTTYPITLSGYLAVRMMIADALSVSLDSSSQSVGHNRSSSTPKHDPATSTDASSADIRSRPLRAVILIAWERTYREKLIEQITETTDDHGHKAMDDEMTSRTNSDSSTNCPDAQLVFCIDTRSEVIRRHIESTGEYETYGYAGFFGIPMRYEGYNNTASVNACPPIVDAQHRISEDPIVGDINSNESDHARYERIHEIYTTGVDIVESLSANVTTAFNFVETTGSGYGVGLAARTLFPQGVYDALTRIERRLPQPDAVSKPQLDTEPMDVSKHAHSDTARSHSEDVLPYGLTHQERVKYAASAFEMMGLETFGRIVGFIGHASQTANNPFGSSLDCGACAGNAGGPSARVLAQVCNDDDVKTSLRDRGIDIPVDTVFIAGEHNTTTDEITLYTETVPESHRGDIASLQTDLTIAQKRAATERIESFDTDNTADAVQDIERRAADWAETRPEWGLAGNASFIIGPRSLTEDIDLEGRTFLHSYDWQQDKTGSELESILAGPMIVTQWINAQYYFATVDTAAYGSGSKITQNPVGNIGIYQGNGGDLMRGLPIQSVRKSTDELYHQPIRLSTVIHAPVSKVTRALADLESVIELLDNNWLSLTVVDPTDDNDVFHYTENLTWIPHGDGYGYEDDNTAYTATEE
ncbi:DUF2309 domain-containing protein [Haloquadratum walsbyi]|jgi:Uncharacterized protein conserved in bacteria|uniref:Probable inorganic carbon transporter subunit DabA n=1 Tax=Haloquadratum walsbyi J07HQW2 TaxID=1238425 RepID=U1NDJ3_9EURY|nr:DUF2309 domain-containing protein [Haloquadratum walsbyi]ERG94808.1 MAG: hypothetical protein J07HQW2_01250 [Haloquadratum walsbyi J07HQW2]